MDELQKRLNDAYESITKGGDVKHALRVCDEVLEADPTLTYCHRTKARIQAYVGNLDEAITEMDIVIAHSDPKPGNHISRGRWRLKNQDWSGAIDDMTTTLELEKAATSTYYTESAYFFRAVAYMKLGSCDKAIADCSNVRDDYMTYLWEDPISKSEILKKCR
jgi:Tfp pilus assembly protein PilF